MLKGWRKSFGKQYQHFKMLKDQCYAFYGGEKPFVHAWRAVFSFEEPLDYRIPGVRLTHSQVFILSVQHGRCRAAALHRERQSWKDMSALSCSDWMWSRFLRGCFFCLFLQGWKTGQHFHTLIQQSICASHIHLYQHPLLVITNCLTE